MAIHVSIKLDLITFVEMCVIDIIDLSCHTTGRT